MSGGAEQTTATGARDLCGTTSRSVPCPDRIEVDARLLAPSATQTPIDAPPPSRPGFLNALNPLSKLLAPVPAMVLLLFTRDPFIPLVFVILSLVLVAAGARLRARTAALVFLGLPLATAVMTVSFGVWTDPARVSDTPVLLTVGPYTLHLGAFAIGATTALRLVSILALTLIAGLTSTGPDLVRSLIQQLRVPYRIGYTALAAYRFIPRFGYELDVIRQAHRVRGMTGGRGPIAMIRRGAGYAIPLLASAIRHAERVALSMDARAFGAHPTRSERYEVPFRVRDWIFVVLFWAATAAVFIVVPMLVSVPANLRSPQ